MAILISNKKTFDSLKLKQVDDVDRLHASDVFETMEGATASIGRFKLDKGFILEFTFDYDEFQYVVKGSLKINAEGRTFVTHEGDIVHCQKGTPVTIISDEGCEFIFVAIPSLKMMGYPLKD